MGERLKKRREAAGLSLGQVGAYEECTPQYLSQLETGKREPNVWDLLARLARRYKTSTDYLLGLTDNPVPTEAMKADPLLQELVGQLLDDFTALTVRDQQMALTLIRTMRKAESEDVLPPKVIGQE